MGENAYWEIGNPALRYTDQIFIARWSNHNLCLQQFAFKHILKISFS
jgi:hypothetical protein